MESRVVNVFDKAMFIEGRDSLRQTLRTPSYHQHDSKQKNKFLMPDKWNKKKQLLLLLTTAAILEMTK